MTLLSRATSSVRVRVTVVASLFVLVVTAVGSVVVVLVIGHSLSQGLIDSAGQDAAAIDAQLGRGVTPAAAATTGRNDVLVQLIDNSGAVVASDQPAQLEEPLRTTAGVTGTVVVPGLVDTYTVVARRASASSQPVALIVVGRSTEQRDNTRAEMARALGIAVPLVVLALGVIVWISVGRALRPVEVMREQADQITATHLPDRLAVPAGSDEIPRLAHTLNEMLDRIDDGQRLQRQFVSDASHELRSPLAVIRQTAEVARAHPDRIGVDQLADDVLHEGGRLEALVGALLLLARLEGHPALHTEPVDLDDIVLVEVARLRDAGARVALDVSAVSAGQTRGSAVLLGQVVSNLLANAVRHASTTVRVGLHQTGQHVELLVDDDGAGVPPEKQDAIFERFVRLDEARTRDEGGSGLGLAIVRSIVLAVGGSVTVGTAPQGGARFTVLLPTEAD
ncbi:sensor histidine kinase [Nocardioides marmoriginsengisoli]|uniref:histidine kinase n=1 Tax=Nocardioides marmoriginsengisoli TaxID=661483 RepID=A0A3N0CN25_9ACTN|nr:HAMP domain-containing sensor histidine kinase [Nocardioides marmoriginsengisoli]RNL64313.1 sensor histidine kinase [Nocardioides marmoriginsengisoli]